MTIAALSEYISMITCSLMWQNSVGCPTITNIIAIVHVGETIEDLSPSLVEVRTPISAAKRALEVYHRIFLLPRNVKTVVIGTLLDSISP